ncbi:hypothetical protein KJ785_00235 [Patescibacteria group bacterium]|nr:hypothetical protein [Patescibacteria group bacterium]
MINYFKTKIMINSDPNEPNSDNSDVIRVIRIADIFNKDKRGAAALLTVIIVGVTSLILAYSASILSMGELEMGYGSQKGSETASVADGCSEEAMQRLRMDASYAGGILNVGSGSCIIGIESNGNDRVVTATASIGNNYKIFQINLTLNGSSIVINSWQEI